MAGEVPLGNAAEPSFSFGVAYHLALIATKLRHRGAAGEHRIGADRFRRLYLSGHALQVGHGASGAFLRDGQTELVPRLEQHRLRRAQPLPYRPVGRLPEVTALGVLDVRFSGDNGYLHVGYRRACQHTDVRLFFKVCQYKSLPVDVKVVLSAVGEEMQPGATLGGFKQQVYLRVVPQRLIVPHTLYRGGDGFLVGNASLVELHLQPEALLYHAFQHFKLYLSH